jgi:hypothetical protein
LHFWNWNWTSNCPPNSNSNSENANSKMQIFKKVSARMEQDKKWAKSCPQTTLKFMEWLVEEDIRLGGRGNKDTENKVRKKMQKK